MNHKIVNEEYEGKIRAFVYSGGTDKNNNQVWFLSLGDKRVFYYLDKFELVWKCNLVNSSDMIIGVTEVSASRNEIVRKAKHMLVHPEIYEKFTDTWYTRAREGIGNGSFLARRKENKYRRKG